MSEDLELEGVMPHNEAEGIYHSLNQIVDQLHDKPKKKVTVGLRPSGQIHLGNMSTLLLSSWLTHYLGASNTELEVTICDIDISADAKGKIAVPFKYEPSPSSQYANLAEYNTSKITEFMALVQSELGISYYFQNLSDVQENPRYRKGLESLVDNRAEAKELITGTVSHNTKVPINPVCPDCHTVTRSFPTFSHRKGGKRVIVADCKNDECSTDRYNFDLYDPDITIAVHYLIDPLRDGVMSPLTDVHVFGGDYLDEHTWEQTKIQKVKRITELAGGTPPLYFIGPTFFGDDGEKMSKSNINGLTFDKLREHFMHVRPNEPWVRHALEFTKYLINERVKQVDYSITRQHLLGGDLTQGHLR